MQALGSALVAGLRVGPEVAVDLGVWVGLVRHDEALLLKQLPDRLVLREEVVPQRVLLLLGGKRWRTTLIFGLPAVKLIRLCGAPHRRINPIILFSIFAARAIHPLIELVRLTFEVGHDKTRVSTLGAVLDAGDDPPGALPGACGVREVVEQQQ